MKLRWKSVLISLAIGSCIGVLLPGLIRSEHSDNDPTTFFAGMEIVELEESLPDRYRVEAPEGIVLLAPEELLYRMLAVAAAPEDDRETLVKKAVLLHSRALALIGDRIEILGEDWASGVWLQGGVSIASEGELAALSDERKTLLKEISVEAAPYFLSIDGQLIRDGIWRENGTIERANSSVNLFSNNGE